MGKKGKIGKDVIILGNFNIWGKSRKIFRKILIE